MTENDDICQVKMSGDNICGRQVYDDKCICHSEREDKDIKLYQDELDKIFANEKTDRYDLTFFVFPKTGYKLPQKINKKVHFSYAHFLGDANFSKARFSSKVVFYKTQFSGEADFKVAQFSGDAIFNFAQYSGKANFDKAQFANRADFSNVPFSGDANFSDVQFLGYSDFRNAQFSGRVLFRNVNFSGRVVFYKTQFSSIAHFRTVQFSCKTYFRNIQFSGDVDFTGITICNELFFEDSTFFKTVTFALATLEQEAVLLFDADGNNNKMFESEADLNSIIIQKDALIKFRKVKLDKCSFLETDLTKIQFIDVEWAKIDSRKCVFDEWIIKNKKSDDMKVVNKKNSNNPSYKLIAQEYRRLQKNFIDNFNYAEAGDFYIGEQEMIRLEKGKYKQYFCSNFMYKIISSYGESYLKPFLILMAVILIIPFFLLYSGVNLQTDSSLILHGVTVLQYESVNYDWSFNPLDIFVFKIDYWKTVYGNTTILMFSKSNIDIYLITWWQKLGVVIEMLVVYILLAFFLLALRRPYRRKSF